jgi:predicted Zn-dependent protease
MSFTFSTPKDWKNINTPRAVGFTPKDKNSQLIFSLADTVMDPSKISEKFLEEYNKRYKLQPTRNEKLEINGFPAHILRFEQTDNTKKTIVTLLWITRDKRTYQFAQMGDENYAYALEEMANSFHVMTDTERNSIHQNVVHVVKANDGETIEELSKRTNNVLDLDYTALINNVDLDTKLSADQWLKIGIKVKF